MSQKAQTSANTSSITHSDDQNNPENQNNYHTNPSFQQILLPDPDSIVSEAYSKMLAEKCRQLSQKKP